MIRMDLFMFVIVIMDEYRYFDLAMNILKLQYVPSLTKTSFLICNDNYYYRIPIYMHY